MHMAVLSSSRLLLPPPPRGATHRTATLSGHHLLPPPSLHSRLCSRASTPRIPRSSLQENGGASEFPGEKELERGAGGKKKEQQEEEEEEKEVEELQSAAATAAEIKERLATLRAKEGASSPDLWSGVAEEIREIEWPAFGKVLGTTGVVLAVIAGSSVALLTVNAVLAEVSDRIFAGKGLQDFF